MISRYLHGKSRLAQATVVSALLVGLLSIIDWGNPGCDPVTERRGTGVVSTR